mmetsp:Transcript_3181/g.9329  ORF Transcript_3181/g.9329 Transcript_3181/m.9329 type:complete len:305 (+) Transcript_3181:217-1131(+)
MLRTATAVALLRTAAAMAARPVVARRAALRTAAAGAASLIATDALAAASELDAGRAAEYYGACAVVPRRLVIYSENVAATVAFLEQGLELGNVEARPDGSTRVAFGPTQLSRPKDFVPGISSFDVDGGHFAFEVRPAAGVLPPDPDKDNVAYVQLALGNSFRASKILKFGGELRDGYGAWSLGAPGGLPLRLVVGDERRDRAMYVAYRCANPTKTAAFYEARGFRRAPYPRARPPTREESPFDPNPPKNSVYLETCPDSFGILLIPDRRKRPPRGLQACGPLVVAGASEEVALDPDGNALQLIN